MRGPLKYPRGINSRNQSRRNNVKVTDPSSARRGVQVADHRNETKVSVRERARRTATRPRGETAPGPKSVLPVLTHGADGPVNKAEAGTDVRGNLGCDAIELVSQRKVHSVDIMIHYVHEMIKPPYTTLLGGCYIHTHTYKPFVHIKLKIYIHTGIYHEQALGWLTE